MVTSPADRTAAEQRRQASRRSTSRPARSTWAARAQPTGPRRRSGLVVRRRKGQVVLDLRGWASSRAAGCLLYLHIDREGRVAAGTYLQRGDRSAPLL